MLAIFLTSGAIAMGELPIIPRPLEQREAEGTLTLKEGGYVYAAAEVVVDWSRQLSAAAGLDLRPAPADAAVAIQFLSADMLPADIARPAGEGYVLRILPTTILVHAATPGGHFHGLQSLVQILEAAPRQQDGVVLEAMTVRDEPRFEWRGFMLDESRHFTGEDGVIRLLDQMARYKMNRFHWHLTDSPGWRIEIKRYPELAKVGGRGSETDRSPDAPAQYYTQEQIRRIVAYAKRKGITIIPEIDMPGHADAAVRAYPQHDGGGIGANGKPFKWSHFTFNPAKPETLEFLDGILEEVASLFPDAGVIHFGGDEVHFGWGKWKELPEVKELMAREGFQELREVETWFNRRMAGRIDDLGFITGGWDEVAARGLPTDQTLVFWWRHDRTDVLRQAIDDGYPVILCPRRPMYFDFVQDESHKVGRRWEGFNPLADVYQFPDSLTLLKEEDWKMVRGIQACLWTEETRTQDRRDFMTFPRLLAAAEAGWTSRDRKDFDDFQKRLTREMPKLQKAGFMAFDASASMSEIRE